MGEVTSNGGRNFDDPMMLDDWSINDPMILDDWYFDDPMILDDDLSLNLEDNAGNEVALDKSKTSEKKKEDVEKGGGSSSDNDDARFFDCNICFEMVKDPVVTCCGHLFCWPCIYRWLNMKSKMKRCPVCKGEVTVTNVTPIYGCGNDAKVHEKEKDSNMNIPLRPNAKRVETRRGDLNACQVVERSLRRNSMYQSPQWYWRYV